jgi:hypothetical protein
MGTGGPEEEMNEETRSQRESVTQRMNQVNKGEMYHDEEESRKGQSLLVEPKIMKSTG